jgi:hypothetical protein
MDALLLFLIGLATGHGVASARRAEPPILPDTHAVARTCIPAPDSLWIADLEEPGTVRWLVQPDGTFCAPDGEELGEALQPARIRE